MPSLPAPRCPLDALNRCPHFPRRCPHWALTSRGPRRTSRRIYPQLERSAYGGRFHKGSKGCTVFKWCFRCCRPRCSTAAPQSWTSLTARTDGPCHIPWPPRGPATEQKKTWKPPKDYQKTTKRTSPRPPGEQQKASHRETDYEKVSCCIRPQCFPEPWQHSERRPTVGHVMATSKNNASDHNHHGLNQPTFRAYSVQPTKQTCQSLFALPLSLSVFVAQSAPSSLPRRCRQRHRRCIVVASSSPRRRRVVIAVSSRRRPHVVVPQIRGVW